MRGAAIAILAILATASAASAEVRFYLIPWEGTGAANDPIRPKYVAAMGLHMETVRYDAKAIYLVGTDVTPAQHAVIAANPDVTVIPANLNQPVGGALNAVQTVLEGLDIPALWILSSHTYRQVLSIVAGYIVLRDRFTGLTTDQLLGAGVTLNSPVGDLTAARRNRLNQAAMELGADTSTITLSTTIRAALRIIILQLSPIRLMLENLEP